MTITQDFAKVLDFRKILLGIGQGSKMQDSISLRVLLIPEHQNIPGSMTTSKLFMTWQADY